MIRILFALLPAVMLLSACGHKHDKLRILTCGIRHESNTFSTLPTTENDFTVLRGTAAIENVPWADALAGEDVELIPVLHAYAWPGGVVERAFYDKIKDEILRGIKAAGKLDAIYLDMHGALHVEGYDDPQAMFAEEIREIVGNDVVICASFDTHGNISKAFYEHLDLLTGFRTVPHRDGMKTKIRAVNMLLETLRSGLMPHIECVEIPILVPGEKSITEVEPLKSVYAQIEPGTELEGIMDISILAGYAWADLPRSAMRVFVVAEDRKYADKAKEIACGLAQQVWDAREGLELDVPSGTIDQMIDLARTHRGKTVFISDSGDNTTAGAPGDNTQVTEAMLRKGVCNVLVAGVVDPETMSKCASAGIGEKVRLPLGGKKDTTFGKPLPLEGIVTFISPDSLLATSRAVAVMDVAGVKVVVLNSRRSFTSLRDFREIGEDPLTYDMVVVKLGYLYPELRDIAPLHLMALTNGFCNLDMESLPFRNVNRPVYPLDRDMVWSAR